MRLSDSTNFIFRESVFVAVLKSAPIEKIVVAASAKELSDLHRERNTALKTMLANN